MEPIQTQLPQVGSQTDASLQDTNITNSGTLNIVTGDITDSQIDSLINSPGNSASSMMDQVHDSFQSVISLAGDLFGRLPGLGSKPVATEIQPAVETSCSCEEAPEFGVPTDTLDIQDYMNQTFTDSGEISEERAMLAVVGWGFNVMNEANSHQDLHAFFNEQKSMLIEQQAASGSIDYQEIAKTILSEAVSQGLIEDFQADHTYGNAMAVASKLTGDSSSLDSEAIRKNKAIGRVMNGLNQMIQNPFENVFRDIENDSVYKPETSE